MTPAPALARLAARTRLIADPGPLLSLAPSDALVSWLHHGAGLVGWGSVARIELRGPHRFARAQRWWDELLAATTVDDEVKLPGSGPVLFGSFAFDQREVSVLTVPEIVVGGTDGQWWITSWERDGCVPSPQPPVRSSGQVRFADGALDGATWEVRVAEAVDRIAAGELDKVVLARDLETCAERPVDLRWPLSQLVERYPGCRTFSVEGLIGATPEILLRLESGQATSRVLAGTLRRTGKVERELADAEALAGSSKDLEEHEYAVRSVAQALARHCDAVDVPVAPVVLPLPNVLHLASDIRARVTDGSTALDLVAALHPSAAVCGTPTTVAQRVIGELEGMSRGRYAGPVGWLDARGDGEWGLALRCGQRDPDDPRRMRLFAGCGIVAGSVPEAELAESVAKLVPMRDALQG